MSASADDSYDPDYEPPEDEIIEYAQWLGMDLETERVRAVETIMIEILLTAFTPTGNG